VETQPLRPHIGHFVIDTEATGFNPAIHHMIELCIVPLWCKLKPLHIYIKPPTHQWSEWSIKNVQTNFPDNWMRKAIMPRDVPGVVGRYLKSVTPLSHHKQPVFVGHNVKYDMRMLTATYAKSSLMPPAYSIIDTIKLFQTKTGTTHRTKLKDALDQYKIPYYNLHTAKDDALATGKLYLAMLK
jgi:DNA polymerase III epsilon subunit-like protein